MFFALLSKVNFDRKKLHFIEIDCLILERSVVVGRKLAILRLNNYVLSRTNIKVSFQKV